MDRPKHFLPLFLIPVFLIYTILNGGDGGSWWGRGFPPSGALIPSSSSIHANDALPSPSVSGTDRPRIAFVLGGPGSGKGTQSQLLKDEFSLHHLSVGAMLRAELSTRGEHYALIKACVESGRLVPSRVTVDLLRKEIFRLHSVSPLPFLIDGFPRNSEQYQHWKEVVGDSVDVHGVLFIDVDERTMTKRILQRAEHMRAAQGRVRSDDNERTIVHRVSLFINETVPVLDQFDSEDLVLPIDGSGSIQETYHQARNLVRGAFWTQGWEMDELAQQRTPAAKAAPRLDDL